MSATSQVRVFVASVNGYGSDGVHAAVRRALEHVQPSLGRNVLIQSDWSGGGGRLTPASSTRPEVAAGLLEVLLGRDPEAMAILSGRGSLRIPARRALRRTGGEGRYRRSGFAALRSRFGRRVRLQPGDESRLYRYQLSVGDLLGVAQRRDDFRVLPPEERAIQRIIAGWEMYHADSLVLMPKLRLCSETGGLSGALALLGQVLPRRVDRDLGGGRVRYHRLADLLELADPDLVVSDGVEVGWGGGSLCQGARPLGLLVVANNAVAHDVVCAHIMGMQPSDQPHLVAAAARGYGSLDLEDFDLKSEVDFATTRLRLSGYGPPPPRSVEEFGAWYQRRTGFAVATEVLPGQQDDSGGASRMLAWLMACWDEPKTREAMKSWPGLSIMIGINDGGPRYPRVALLGGRAISDFPRHCVGQQTVVTVPKMVRPWVGGIAELIRFRRRDGRRGWAVAVPGDPPSLGEVSLALGLFSLGRIRSPLLKLDGVIDRGIFRLIAFIQRRRKNSKGVAVVHARKIPRLQSRPWRRLWAQPARLRLREGVAVTDADQAGAEEAGR